MRGAWIDSCTGKVKEGRFKQVRVHDFLTLVSFSSAFNDPPCDVTTTAPYIVVDLDEACRKQQLGEGWFPTLDEVPKQAISMSMRHILASKAIITTVPDARKARALKNSVQGPVTPQVGSGAPVDKITFATTCDCSNYRVQGRSRQTHISSPPPFSPCPRHLLDCVPLGRPSPLAPRTRFLDHTDVLFTIAAVARMGAYFPGWRPEPEGPWLVSPDASGQYRFCRRKRGCRARRFLASG